MAFVACSSQVLLLLLLQILCILCILLNAKPINNLQQVHKSQGNRKKFAGGPKQCAFVMPTQCQLVKEWKLATWGVRNVTSLSLSFLLSLSRYLSAFTVSLMRILLCCTRDNETKSCRLLNAHKSPMGRLRQFGSKLWHEHQDMKLILQKKWATAWKPRDWRRIANRYFAIDTLSKY